MIRKDLKLVVALMLTCVSVGEASAQWPNQRALEAQRQRHHELWLQEEALRTQQRMAAELQAQRFRQQMQEWQDISKPRREERIADDFPKFPPQPATIIFNLREDYEEHCRDSLECQSLPRGR